MSNQELSSYIIKRMESIKMVKAGFNILNVIRVCILSFKKKRKNCILNNYFSKIVDSRLWLEKNSEFAL
jgi:hypothetical protein